MTASNNMTSQDELIEKQGAHASNDYGPVLSQPTLMGLPPEIRLEILRYVLVAKLPIGGPEVFYDDTDHDTDEETDNDTDDDTVSSDDDAASDSGSISSINRHDHNRISYNKTEDEHQDEDEAVEEGDEQVGDDDEDEEYEDDQSVDEGLPTLWPGILRVCRQLYIEGIHLLHENTVRINYHLQLPDLNHLCVYAFGQGSLQAALDKYAGLRNITTWEIIFSVGGWESDDYCVAWDAWDEWFFINGVLLSKDMSALRQMQDILVTAKIVCHDDDCEDTFTPIRNYIDYCLRILRCKSLEISGNLFDHDRTASITDDVQSRRRALSLSSIRSAVRRLVDSVLERSQGKRISQGYMIVSATDKHQLRTSLPLDMQPIEDILHYMKYAIRNWNLVEVYTWSLKLIDYLNAYFQPAEAYLKQQRDTFKANIKQTAPKVGTIQEVEELNNDWLQHRLIHWRKRLIDCRQWEHGKVLLDAWEEEMWLSAQLRYIRQWQAYSTKLRRVLTKEDRSVGLPRLGNNSSDDEGDTMGTRDARTRDWDAIIEEYEDEDQEFWGEEGDPECGCAVCGWEFFPRA
jgi:hypothetical protein